MPAACYIGGYIAVRIGLESAVIPGPSELVELLVALVSLFTALIELSEALKQHSKHNKSLPLRH